MAYYSWKGILNNGKLIMGEYFAKNCAAVFKHLAALNIAPLQIKREWLPSTSGILHFTQQVALLLNANIPIREALNTLAQSQKSKKLKIIIQQLQQNIENGMNLSQAMSYFPCHFNTEYCTFIQAGEITGQLHITFRDLSKLRTRQHKIKNQIKKTLSYPIFLLICTIAISLGITLFIIPKYQNFFAEFHSKLPTLTAAVLHFSILLQHHSGLIATSSSIAVMGTIIALRRPKVKLYLHQWLLHIPLLNALIVRAMLCQWTYLLAVAMTTHIPLLSAITLANRVITNSELQRLFRPIVEDLAAGKTLVFSLQKIKFFPPTVLQMILIGESTGTLALIFDKIAKTQQEELSYQLTRIIKYAEPLIMIVLALFTGSIIAALYLPMINLGLNL